MTLYCNGSTEAKVTYRFDGQPAKVLNFKNCCPIEVNTGFAGYQNYNSGGFQLTFYSPNNWRIVQYTVRGYSITNGVIMMVGCDGTTQNTGIDPNTLVIDSSVKCNNTVTAKQFIEVKYQGNRLFYDEQEGNISYTVGCGGECPEGFMRCECDTYPGYSCIPCNSLQS